MRDNKKNIGGNVVPDLFYPGSAQVTERHKIVVLGDAGVGKTSIVTMFMYNTFEQQYSATVGIDFLSKTVDLDGLHIRLQIWDTAGQERFGSLIPSYIRDCSAAMVVYDVGGRMTFEHVLSWKEKITAENRNVPVILIGNKADTSRKREVSFEDGVLFAKKNNMKFIETSAMKGTNINEVFKLAALSVARQRPRPPTTEQRTTLRNPVFFSLLIDPLISVSPLKYIKLIPKNWVRIPMTWVDDTGI